jgi:carboxypeptidase T
MHRKLSLLLLILLVCINLPAIERAVVRIISPSPELVSSYQDKGYDIAAYFPGHWLDLVVPVSEIADLRLRHPDLQITQTEGTLKTNLSSSDRYIAGYHSYATMLTELNTLVSQHSDIMTMSSIGTGWGAQYFQSGFSNYQNFNHDIIAIKVSDNPAMEEDEPALFFVGAHHAREPLSVEATLAVLQDLADNYGSDPFVTDLVNSSAIWFVPMINPDGHKIVWDQTDTWWRKNIRDNDSDHVFDTEDYYGYGDDGVDLNRNYDFEWGYFSASDFPEDVIYHGPGPFSEPETQAFRDLLLAHPFVAGISFHTYSELVLYPYGYMPSANAPDVQELAGLAYDMASLIPSEQSGNYTPEASWVLYPTSGSLDDWAYGEHGIFSYTIELSTEFIPNATTVNLVTQRVKPAARKLMERLNHSMLTGHVTDSVTRQPLEATIFVDGIDDSPIYRAPYKSKLPYGRYYRLLPGNAWFNVRVFAPGYLPNETMINISDTGITTFDVALLPAAHTPLSVNILTFGDIPVPGAQLEFANSDYGILTSDASGIITLPDFAFGHYHTIITKEGYETIDIWQTIIASSLSFLLSDSPFISQDFETTLSAWTKVGSWNLTASQFHSGLKCLTDSPNGDYQDNVNSYAKLSAPLSLINFANACLSFYVKSDIALDGDYCTIEYSVNNQDWFALDYFNGSFDWTRKTYSLNAFQGMQIFLRFHMVTNDYQGADGIYLDDFLVYGSGTVPNQEETQLPLIPVLSIYPNPFKSNTNFQISLDKKKAIKTELAIYNLKGQLVDVPLCKILTKGSHTAVWNGCDSEGRKVASGIYYAVLRLDGKPVKTHKLLLIK